MSEKNSIFQFHFNIYFNKPTSLPYSQSPHSFLHFFTPYSYSNGPSIILASNLCCQSISRFITFCTIPSLTSHLNIGFKHWISSSMPWWWCGGGGDVDPIPCVSTHRISDPRSGPAQLLPPHVKQRSYPHGVRPQIPDR